MIAEEIKNIKSGKDELRKFGISLAIMLCLAGGMLLLRGKSYYHYFFIFSVVFLFIGLVIPLLLKPLHKIWMSLAIFVGEFMTKIILIALFYLVVTPIGLLAKLFGKDFLKLKFSKNSMDSYWISKKESEFDKRKYENQF